MKTKYFFVGMVVLVMAVMSSSVAYSVSEMADTTATIIAPITVNNTQALNFGQVIANSESSGTVVIDTNGVRTVTSVATSTGSPVSQATFDIGGDTGHSYSVNLPGLVTISANSGANSMTVENFTSDKLDTSIPGILNIGATLNVKADQAIGSYTGTFSIEVNYD